MKKSKILFLFVISVFSSFRLSARDLTPQEIDKKFFKINFLELDDIFGNPTLLLNENRVFIVDYKQCRVFIFDKKNGKKIAECGNHGEGPSEFKWIDGAYCDEKAIYICSPLKVTVFSQDGQLLKEQRITILDGHMCIPIGQNYFYQHYIYESGKTFSYFAYSILDQNFKLKKTIFKERYFFPVAKDKSKKGVNPFRECHKGVIYKDRFYLGFTEKGFYLAVFDRLGNRLYEIDKKYDKIPITNAVKQMIFALLKRMYGENYDYRISKTEHIFQENFPAFSSFFIYKDRIIAFKFPRPGLKGLADLVLLDLKGNIIAEKGILLGNIPLSLSDQENNTFYNGKIYYLVNFPEKVNIVEFSLDNLIEYYFKDNIEKK